MASCLDNLVAVRGCESTSAQHYLNELQGINIPDFDKALNPEQASAKTVLSDIIGFASKHIITDINSYLGNKYQLKSFIDNDVVGYYYDNKVLMPSQTGTLCGYEIRIDKTPYLSFFLQSISLFCNYTGNVNVVVYDLIQGKLLDTITIAAVAGEIVTLNGLDKTYPTHKQRLRLFIGYESTFQAYNTSFTSVYSAPVSDNCNTCNGSYRQSHIYFRAAQIATTSPKTAAYISGNTTSGGAGLSFSYSLQCSFEEYLCNIRNQLAMPLLYKAGSLVMKEFKHSRRLTGVVTIYNKSHDELMIEYEAESKMLLSNLLQSAVIPDSLCFNCTPKVRSVTVLP